MKNYPNVKFLEEGISYKKIIRWETIPYKHLVQAYRQVEDAKASLCCGQAHFEIHRVILVDQDGKQHAVELPDRETGVELLERLKEKEPSILIGKRREDGPQKQENGPQKRENSPKKRENGLEKQENPGGKSR